MITAVVIALLLPSVSAQAAITFSKLPAAMNEGRYAPAVATLPNGNVMIAGGYPEGSGKPTNKAELFKPETGTFEKLAAETTVNRGETAFSGLPNGEVLIAGGYNSTTKDLKSAELFNPTTNTFEKLTAEMSTARDGAAAALLHNGEVLIVGGANETTPGPELKTAELYNPASQKFEVLPAKAVEGRYEPVAATLPNGKVLIAGGYNESAVPSHYLKSAELFNPATGTFEELTAEMNVNRDEQASVALQNGEVLIAGGYNNTSKNLKSAEVFNPTTNTFEMLPDELNAERDGPAAALLHDGRVLIVGGYNEIEAMPDRYLKSAEETSVTMPTVTTVPATAIGMTSATLGGTELSEVVSAAYFQYGTSAAYGASTAHQSIAASLSPSPVSVSVSGLTPATTYHFRAVAENAGGTVYGADQTFTTPVLITKGLPPVPPSITNVKQSQSKWREGKALASISRHRKKRAPVGTTFSFTLGEQATVSLTFTQKVNGRKVKGKCVAQSKANKRSHRCTRTVNAGTLSLSGHPGADAVTFQGSISASQKLKPGAYTLTIIATNATGLHSAPAKLTFTIVK